MIMESKQLLKDFGSHLKEIRISKGLSQEALSLISDLDRTYISGIERGRRNISLINIFRLAEALDITAPELFQFGEN